MCTDIALTNLVRPGDRNKPSVQAAYLRTLYNGWCTQGRFRFCLQKRVHKKYCLMACGNGCDSIEHYAQCSTIASFFSSVGLNNYSPNISIFLMIQRGPAPTHISLHGCCLYAVYITHSILRYTDDIHINLDEVRQHLRAAFNRSGNR